MKCPLRRVSHKVPGMPDIWQVASLFAIVLMALFPLQDLNAVVFESREFASKVDEQRYRDLIEELRCLVCQNQNVADSNAGLATDLRNEVHTMIVNGSSDQQIVDFMVARYGDFVLYRPPLRVTTLALWGGPLVLTFAGLWMLYRIMGRRTRDVDDGLSDLQRERLEVMIARAESRDGESARL